MKTYSFLFLILIITVSSCRKKISVPDDSLKNIFGKWLWVESFQKIGGFNTPATAGYSRYRTYSPKGVFEEYQDKKRQQKLKYHFSTSNGSFTNSNFTLVYEHRTFHLSESHSTESIMFKGLDTLVLYYDCDTCGFDMYIKQ